MPSLGGVDEIARPLKMICVPSIHLLMRQDVLHAAQLIPSAPWQVPVSAVQTEHKGRRAGWRRCQAAVPHTSISAVLSWANATSVSWYYIQPVKTSS